MRGQEGLAGSRWSPAGESRQGREMRKIQNPCGGVSHYTVPWVSYVNMDERAVGARGAVLAHPAIIPGAPAGVERLETR